MLGDDNDLKSCKVVLVGESGVGKTCITSNFIYETFNSDEMTTTAASFVSKTITFNEYNGINIKYDIWDTAGQENYRSLAKIFYKSSNAAILVYDITDKRSFEEIKKYWYKQIKENCPQSDKFYYYLYLYIWIIVIALAANKGDLFSQEEVKEEEGKKYAKEIGALFQITSACTGIGINELFYKIGCKLLNPNFSIDNDNDNDKNNKNNNNVRNKKNENEQLAKTGTIKLNKKEVKKMNKERKKKKKFCWDKDYYYISISNHI